MCVLGCGVCGVGVGVKGKDSQRGGGNSKNIGVGVLRWFLCIILHVSYPQRFGWCCSISYYLSVWGEVGGRKDELEGCDNAIFRRA